LATVDEDEVEYEDYVTCAKRLAGRMKYHDKVDMVVAVTHMRVPNDERAFIVLSVF
jgi:2',3'-cyclic-nucleotide 2'-phosphodiesterase (5'-nucleotidase family)